MSRIAVISIVVFTVVAATGCSDKLPVSGTVTFADDGEAVPYGTIYFESDEIVSRGNIGSDGGYRLSSVSKNDGIPKGEYRVYFRGVDELPTIGKDGQEIFSNISLIEEKYVSPATTELIVTIDGSKKKYDWSLDRSSKRTVKK